ncbi:hypothetical protein ASD8599_00258 [Ascidiaceihabitans donghaensis]|uniref:DNA topoisomerase n=1 Tax=Ascidiaceihabitans donghaensis TaxID=1510460 RepID=A0A2R8B914_9RHOB|nr:DNA topoisomerase IB [Ascidiaceihabitans donghaensis]SPH19532.1 hypothetical protein ASD8599_00258 [Ascidiaceihabitans donghaensis]
MQTDLPDTLTWYPDTHPGITRRKAGRGWSYRAPDGTRIEQAAERKRIDALAVPPAYEKVWISPRPNGHLQATGYDARTRKQYRYHTDFSAFRSQTKFDDLARFGAALPSIRRKIASGIARDDLSEDFTVAVVLRLIDRASLRVGTPDYAAENKTFGATTLRGRHVDFDAGTVHVAYTGKGGKDVRKTLQDRRLHRALHRLDDLPGGEIMQCVDGDGSLRSIGPEHVNSWLRDVTGEDGLTAKTFRTWNGSVAALDVALRSETPPTILAMTQAAADCLHNTPTIARNSYVHPKVIALHDSPPPDIPNGPQGLRQAERALLSLL